MSPQTPTEQQLQFDQEHIWHPYTSMTSPLPVYPVVSASGVRLTLADGRELIDGMASWWSAIHGYNHPVLNQAITEQLSRMSHVMFGGITHQPAIELAETLISITADNLQHVFFADSGSVGVEVALKMAIQYWHAQDKTSKSKMLTVRNGYHGDTFGAMAVTDPEGSMHSLYKDILPKHFFADAPNCWRNDNREIAHNATQLHKVLEQHHDEIAAIILEPIVQGAGGMRIYCPEYLQAVRAYCDEYDVLLILDEIATGFGRTGKLFGYEHADIQADILVVGKALTGGYMTLAATLCSSKVAHGISQNQGVLMHGPTFMANPLACSVANANLALLLNADWQSNIQRIEHMLRKKLSVCGTLPMVKDVRVIGAIGIIEMQHPVDMESIQREFVNAGIWVRPFGKLVYMMPPYIISDNDLTTLCTSIIKVITQQSPS
ncbi:MAG: Adenosylmethionine-8-amino-7-oxononanoate aminotransferase (EC [uncultured Thiotrichaceae bacterium]|uniref:Adenosylmethionine-8-amino-7-oxononanoate aminotransferase n=1 Tax=uncultured Thiotrichaceae bacterium TaxID=298394 RepID=A0A6S6T8K2_9GAMM|nr:MAG: Adenosylmethionine-8-amino-7-oxononanoate aminotransferase (EC [uncultured Thiotrichaceae bacterium]